MSMKHERFDSIPRIEKSVEHFGAGTEVEVFEKAHGCNFAIYHGETMSQACRSGFVGPEWRMCGQTVDRYRGACEKLLQDLGAKQLIVRGEYIGGLRGGKTLPDAKKVMKKVDYCPGNEFLVFQIEADGEVLPFTPGAAEEYGFKEVPYIGKMTLGEVAKLELPESRIPELLGMTDDVPCMIEGVVCTLPEGQYLKKIFKAFDKSKSSTPRRESLSDAGLSDEELAFKDAFLDIATELKVENVVSKRDSPELSDIPIICGELMQELKEELVPSKAVWHKLRKPLGRHVSNMVRGYVIDLQ